MALYRRPPSCPECGETIKGRYRDMGAHFVGDTFAGWDWQNHRCRLGTKYFIERSDTNEWWPWTNDPMKALMFDTRAEAEKYLTESTKISARINCTVTEHEFVRVQPAREPNLKDALAGYRKRDEPKRE